MLLFIALLFSYLHAATISFVQSPTYVNSNVVAILQVSIDAPQDIVLELFYPGWQWMSKYDSVTLSSSGQVTLTITGIAPGNYDIKASVRYLFFWIIIIISALHSS